ncbi:MAG TPA: dockerin type I domain-containing protein, partial [Fimbriimonadaceae bacterium]|nr:dockerin type I domain-containing protein [Fimbriimonadaceae bacterium]
TPIDSQTVLLDASGNFQIATTATAGTYDITAKASHWLRSKLSSQTLASGGLNGLSYTLTNGDVNGDNSVSLADFGQLKLAYGSSPGGSNWNANADLDGNGSVGLSDFGILKLHYGQSGAP